MCAVGQRKAGYLSRRGTSWPTGSTSVMSEHFTVSLLLGLWNHNLSVQKLKITNQRSYKKHNDDRTRVAVETVHPHPSVEMVHPFDMHHSVETVHPFDIHVSVETVHPFDIHLSVETVHPFDIHLSVETVHPFDIHPPVILLWINAIQTESS